MSNINTDSITTDIALLPPGERAVIVLDATKTAAQLHDLVAASAGLLTVTTPDEREQVHRAAMTLRGHRTTIAKTGKAARDDANAFCSAVIAEEKRLVQIIQPEEDRLMNLRQSYDAEQARLKAEAEAREKARVDAIKAKIEQIRRLPDASFRDDAATLAATLDDLRAFVPLEEDFAEFVNEAREVALASFNAITALHTRAAEAEAAAERLRIEQEQAAARKAELDRQAAELAAQQRQAEEKRQREEAEAAERRRQAEAELQAQREALDAERRAFEEKQAAAARAAEEAARTPVVDLAAIADFAESVELASDKIDFTILPPSKQAADAVETGAPLVDPVIARIIPEEPSATEQAVAEVVTGMDLAGGQDQTSEEKVVLITKGEEVLGSVRVTDIAQSDMSEDGKEVAIAERCIEVGVQNLQQIGCPRDVIYQIFEIALDKAFASKKEAA